jgi:hypothetical protein
VAQPNLRIAAGVGVVAACLLVAGPSAAVAIADPGGRHSGHSDNSSANNTNNKASTSGSSRTSGSDYSDDNINNGGSGADSRPSSRVGSGRESGTSDERPSNDYSPAPPQQSRSPKVTFGDGRTPGVQDHESEPRGGWNVPQPPPPPPPPQIITVPLNPPVVAPVSTRPGVVQQLVTPAAGVADPLWGVAGLLLIPAAGAILGYRQARGAHAAAELGRHP